MEKLMEILNMAIKEIDEIIEATGKDMVNITLEGSRFKNRPSATVYLYKKESLDKWAALVGTDPDIEIIKLGDEEYIKHSVQIGKIEIYAFEKIEQTKIEQTEPEDETAE